MVLIRRPGRIQQAHRLLHSALCTSTYSFTTSSASDCLFYEQLASSSAAASPAASPVLTACVVHGLLGAGKNLRTLAQQMCDKAEDQGSSWRAVLVDQRNHGRSARRHLHPPHNLQTSARDVINLFRSPNFNGRAPEVMIGHSMGGKVVLEYVKQLAAAPGTLPLPKQVWVLDARPGRVDEHSGVVQSVNRVLHAIQSVPLPVPSRQWLLQHMQNKGFSAGLTQWLGSNLHYEGRERYGWVFNMEGVLAMFDAYCRADYLPLLRSPPPGVTINLVRAAKSDRWDAASVQVIEEAVSRTADPSPNHGTTRFFELPDAGHWVHTDNPRGLLDMMLPSLQEAAGT